MIQITNYWQVLRLFLIPVGGGIPAGVLLARDLELTWPIMMILYFISDVILACLFEPLMLLFASMAKKSSYLVRFRDLLRHSVQRTTAHYGTRLGPLSLVLVAFGVDPMTGRAAAAAAGYGFVKGWMIAIAGDMIYFTVLMVSTLWLDHFTGSETWTTLLILLGMFIIPGLIRRFRKFSTKCPSHLS